MIFAFLLLLRLLPGSFGDEHVHIHLDDDKGADTKFSTLEMELVKEDPFSHCSGKGNKTKDCCFMCENCNRCQDCALCGDPKNDHLISKEACKFCPLCAKDCVPSGFCGNVCKLENLPEAEAYRYR